MSNVGKVFEGNFKKSVPEYCLIHRLPDPPQSFNQNEQFKFSWKNPCDFFMFDSKKHRLFCLELKTTKQTSISYENINTDEKQNKMIHKHQILSLKDFSRYDGIVCGFIFNFRDEKNNTERTYFQEINDFINMCKLTNKCSLNEYDLITNKAKPILGEKKRVNYKWNIEKFLDDLE